MLDRFLSVVGACGLIIVLTGIVPMVPAYAEAQFGEGCSGDGCPLADEDDESSACKGSDYEEDGDCTGTGCGCKTTSSGCICKK